MDRIPHGRPHRTRSWLSLVQAGWHGEAICADRNSVIVGDRVAQWPHDDFFSARRILLERESFSKRCAPALYSRTGLVRDQGDARTVRTKAGKKASQP